MTTQLNEFAEKMVSDAPYSIEEAEAAANRQLFVEYVESFYLPTHPDVLYPIEGLTSQMIEDALDVYIERIEKGDLEYVHWTWGYGDSLDRERVRDIILETL
tara:strand:+ start:12037 stop:12342 length:306 start_codon:yes stop_codon:yes gene_type:complete